MKQELVFLKLGGSVITDKDQPNTPDLPRIQQFAAEIAQARKENTSLSILLGHGSGSFGHHAASQYQTREGVTAAVDWQGFAIVGERAKALNQELMRSFTDAGLPVVSFSPFSMVRSNRRQIMSWDISSFEVCLKLNLIPVIYGDVILDRSLGGTILSTEELFAYLAAKLHPSRVLLAGLEEGVWKDFPARESILKLITPGLEKDYDSTIHSSASKDVTGGMRSKVDAMLKLVEKVPELEIQIFSGVNPGSIYQVLQGSHIGTVIRNSKGSDHDLQP